VFAAFELAATTAVVAVRTTVVDVEAVVLAAEQYLTVSCWSIAFIEFAVVIAT
jgi:hypothetical protein